MLRKPREQSWSISISTDIALNFALYVGCSYGLIPSETYSGAVPLWPYKQLG